MATAAPALGRLAEETIAQEAKETVLPAIRSFGSFLRRSKAGSYLEGLLKDQYEPMSKQAQAGTRQVLEKAFTSVPPDLHKEVTAAVLTGKPSTSIAVNQAAQTVRQVYQGMSHTKVDFQGYGETELLKWLNWNKKAVTTATRKQIMGEGDEILSSVLNAAEAEKGPHYANSIADGLDVYFHQSGGGYPEKFRLGANKLIEARTEKAGVIRPSSQFKNVGDFERWLRGKMAWSFTPRIVIPHLSQAINSLLVNGPKATAKATWELASGNMKNWQQFILDSGTMEDEMFYHLVDNKSWVNKLRQPGFTAVRGLQLKFNAVAGQFAARDAARSLMEGGGKKAENQLKLLGLDPTIIRQQGGQLSDEQIKTAMYRGAAETMFIRSGLQTPYAWDETPFKRAIWMYKHYMFNEGRLIADSFRRAYDAEGVKGAMKVAGIIGTVFPAAGFAVSQMENIATGHPVGELPKSEQFTGNQGIDEYFSSIGHVAGFGIGLNMMHAARRRSLVNYMAGPIYSSVFDLFQDIGSGNWREATRDITRKGGVIGPLFTNIFIPPKKKSDSSTKDSGAGYY